MTEPHKILELMCTELASHDAQRDDTLMLSRAMEGQGRSVVVDRVPGVDHGFLHGGEENAAAIVHLADYEA